MKKLAILSIAALTISAIYLYAWPAPNVFYAAVVLFHVGLGVLFCIGGLRMLPTAMRQPMIVKLATLVLIVGAALGLGADLHRRVASVHEAAAVARGGFVPRRGAARRVVVQPPQGRKRATRGFPRWAAVAVAVVVTLGAQYARTSWSKRYIIRNPEMAPLSMNNEGDGVNGNVLPQFVASRGRSQDPVEVLHGVRRLRALPPGHLQAVEQLGASLLVVQQSVVPQEHRVHAGRQRGDSRRSGARAATIRRCSTAA